MNRFYRKAAAVITAGIMAATSFCTECFAAEKTAGTGSVTVEYGATAVAKPTYTIKGTKGVRKVLLKTATEGATIYYTVNGSVPTANSYKYTPGTLLLIQKDVKFRAVAIKDGVSSDVMTKTVKVASLVGDVTGDGRVNNNDYKRFVSYANGKTTYACWDNMDCDGSGTVTRGDINVLLRYLNSEISALPYTGVEAEDPEGADDASGVPASSSGSTGNNSSNTGNNSSSGGSSSATQGNLKVTYATPGYTVYRSYGGKKVEYESPVSGATIYYTTDGSNPTTSSNKYNGRFLITQSCTVKAFAVKGNECSKTLALSISVGSTSSVSTSTDTNKIYSGSTVVDLLCGAADSVIYYTTDGTDPATSSTAKLYSGPFKIITTTYVKAVAMSKGNANSKTATFYFSFGNDYTLSGTIFSDENANGVKDSNEKGISGLNVYAYDIANKTYPKQTTTGSSGEFAITGLTKGKQYQIVTEFNMQKYRTVSSSLINAKIPALTIKSGGAYDSTGNKFSTANKLSDALKGNFYVVAAFTGKTYSESNINCDLALVPMDNSYLSVSMTTVGASSSNKVMNGDRLSYKVTLTNNSPTQTLSDVNMGFYYTSGVFSQFSLAGISYKDEGTRDGYKYYTIMNLLGSSGLAPGKSVTFTFSGTVGGTVGSRISCYAEITSYRFENSLYDCYSIPGDLTVGGSLNAGERDEATVSPITISQSSGGSSEAEIVYNGSTKTFTIYQGETVEFDIIIRNVSSYRDYELNRQGVPTYATFTTSTTYNGTEHIIHFKVTGNTAGNAGRASFCMELSNNPDKYVTIYVYVERGRRS